MIEASPSGTADEFAPYLISWNLTQRCNLYCKHCYIDASSAAPGELSTSEALRVLDEIAAVSPEALLILTGGEPLLRSDLEVLVEHAAAQGMTVVLGTNGTLLSRWRAVALKECGLSAAGISLDSLLPRNHDEFRGKEGAWRSAVRGIESALWAGLDVQVQMTLTRDNITELPGAVRFARGLGARVLTAFFLVCTGRGQNLVDLTPEEYEDALRQLAGMNQDGIMIRPRCAPTFRRVLAQTNPDSILLQSDTARCMAGKNYCRITPEGELTPCPYMPLTAGRLRERSFSDIWESAAVFQALRHRTLKGRCGECEYQELCGGCRARAFSDSGDLLAEDPGCAYVPGTDGPLTLREEGAVAWSAEADARMGKVPFFFRRTVRSAVEAFARQQGAAMVTAAILDEARQTMRRP